MKKNQFKKPPFSIDRSHWGDLAAQLAGQLRTAIETGYYSAGDILPPVRDLAMLLDVSKGIAEQAIAIIRNEGLISPRPAQGSVVLGRGEKLWKGNVLVVTRSDGRGYYEGVFVATLRAALVKAGWLFTWVNAMEDAEGKIDTSELELQLKAPVTLAVSIFGTSDTDRALSRSGIPFVTLDHKPGCRLKGCVGHVRYNSAVAAGELAKAARDAGVKSVTQVGFGSFDDVFAALKAGGMKVSRWDIKLPTTGKRPETAAFATREEFLSKCRMKNVKCKMKSAGDGKNVSLPDMIYFSDDFACVGALAAFAEIGVRVPEDVRIATWSNLGNNPVFTKELTRTEMDPDSDAAKFAGALLAHLEGRDTAFPSIFGPTFKKGATL